MMHFSLSCAEGSFGKSPASVCFWPGAVLVEDAMHTPPSGLGGRLDTLSFISSVCARRQYIVKVGRRIGTSGQHVAHPGIAFMCDDR